MGKVVELAPAQRQRAARRRAMVEEAAMHPALRWLAKGGNGKAHRRRTDGRTSCGLLGPLVLADADTTFCGTCYPYWSSVPR
jgi:hypothetical protein